MPIVHLDRKTVAEQTLPTGKTFELYWDDTLKGFGFLIRKDASGAIARSFVVQYRFGKKQRKQKIADAAKLTVDQARKRATEMFAQITLGTDPAAKKEEARAAAARALTFATAVERYLPVKERELRPTSYKNTELYLTRPQYFGALHGRDLNEIRRADIATCLTRIAPKEVTRGRARAAISTFYVWAMQEGLAEQNPVIGTKPQADRPQGERVLDDEELRMVWNACDMNTDFGKILRLLILTGCRRQEIGSLRWSWLDLDKGTMTIPSTVAKNYREHTLMLPDMAMEIIRSVPERKDRDQLFGERAEVGFNAWRYGLRALNHGIVKKWRLHDIRRSVATGMADIGVQPHIIEAVINHASGHKAGVAGIYNRSNYTREVKNALALWADHIHSVASGDVRKVIAFAQRA
jgi:integrase